MPNNASVSHYQQRARGRCALCHDPVDDADDRLHHVWCARLYTVGWRVGGLRAMTTADRQRLATESYIRIEA